jgi:hypothetical protein
MTPPFAGSRAGKFLSVSANNAGAFEPAGAAWQITIPVTGLVKSAKPAAEPYPIAKCSRDVSVSKMTPAEMEPPEPVLFVTGGTMLAGLSPTAASDPAGEMSKYTSAADEVSTDERRTAADFSMFMLYLSFLSLVQLV